MFIICRELTTRSNLGFNYWNCQHEQLHDELRRFLGPSGPGHAGGRERCPDAGREQSSFRAVGCDEGSFDHWDSSKSRPSEKMDPSNALQLDKLDDDHLAILKNKYLLAFSQDPEIGRPAYPYKWGYNEDWTYDPKHPAEYWSGPSSTLDGTLVLMLNSEGVTSTRTAVWSEIPELKKGKSFQVVDAWTGKDLGCVKDQYSVDLKRHDAAVLLVKGCC